MLSPPPKTLVIALAGIAWNELVARVGNNRLPGIAALMARGSALRLIDDVRVDRAAAWATLGTGVLANRHLIAGREESWAGGTRPIGRDSWATAPVMARLAEVGLATMSVGWPNLTPGARWRGVHVDGRLAHASGRDFNEWLPPRGVAPADWTERLADIRVHPTDVTADLLSPFVPDLAAVDQRTDRSLVDLALMIARLSTERAALRLLLAEAPWDVAFVFHGWLAEILARFANAPPPYDGIVAAAWTLLDTLVAMTLTEVRRDTTVVLVSLGWGGQPGFVAAAGPEVKNDLRADVAHAVDIVPTLLARYGLADPTLAGRALFGAPPRLIAPPPAADLRPRVAVDRQALARVAACGLQPPAVPPAWHRRRLLTLAMLTVGHDIADAAALAQQAIDVDGDDPVALGLLAAAAVAADRRDALIPLAERIEAVAPDHLWAALVRGGWHAMAGDAAGARPYLARVEEQGGADELMRTGAAWLIADRPLDAARVFASLCATAPLRTDALIGLAMAQATTDPQAATEALTRALALDPANRHARTLLAGLQRQLGRTLQAVQTEAGGKPYARPDAGSDGAGGASPPAPPAR